MKKCLGRRNYFDSSHFLGRLKKMFNNQRSMLNVQGREKELRFAGLGKDLGGGREC